MNQGSKPVQGVLKAFNVRSLRESARRFWEYLRSQPEPDNPAKLRALLFRLVVIRVVVLTMLLGASAWSVFVGGAPGPSAVLVYWPIAVTYAISIVNVLWLRVVRRVRRFAYLQLCADVGLSTLAVYCTGGAMSPLIILYLVVIVGGALILGHSGAVIIAALSGLSYAGLASGLIPPLAGDTASASATHILAVYMALVMIAVVSGYLSRQLERVWDIAALHERRFTELSSQQRQLFDDISEGIITLDLEAAITSINKAARSIIGLSELDADKLLGNDFPSVMRRFGIDDAKRMLMNNAASPEPEEITLRNLNHHGDVCLNYSVRSLTDSAGNESGWIMLFNDVSHVRSMEKRLSLHEQMTKLLAQSDTTPLAGSDGDALQLFMVGESPIMRQVLGLVDRVSNSDVSVLITGESGTGKELIAKAIHIQGPRKQKPFVAINCGAIPENLIESELFGHKKGSFTGAHSDQPGLFRQANGGTIFLDEIGELPVQMQTKLLRVLQEKMVRAVGDVRDVSIDVRVIAATNRDLKLEIARGAFREDLFYRLNVVNVVVPPLRNRSEDIPLLVRHFIGRFTPPGKVLPQVSPEALEQLMNYPFPGNIRELENLVERALVLGGNAILPEHLPEEVRRGPRPVNGELRAAGDADGAPTAIHVLPVDLEQELARIEQYYLQQALARSGGLKKQAAELLGLNFRSFRYRLKKYGMGESTTND